MYKLKSLSCCYICQSPSSQPILHLHSNPHPKERARPLSGEMGARAPERPLLPGHRHLSCWSAGTHAPSAGAQSLPGVQPAGRGSPGRMEEAGLPKTIRWSSRPLEAEGLGGPGTGLAGREDTEPTASRPALFLEVSFPRNPGKRRREGPGDTPGPKVVRPGTAAREPPWEPRALGG